jgi:CheY-like chemotaxis protein
MRTLLLVEDDEHVARSLVRLLAPTGCAVVHVASGDAALAALRSRSFDLVLSDLRLPGASGIEVLRVARAIDPALPLILMSGSPTAATARDAEALGVVAYLAKPVLRAELTHALQLAGVIGSSRAGFRKDAATSCDTFAE